MTPDQYSAWVAQMRASGMPVEDIKTAILREMWDNNEQLRKTQEAVKQLLLGYGVKLDD